MNDDVCPPGTFSLLQHLGYEIIEGRWQPQGPVSVDLDTDEFLEKMRPLAERQKRGDEFQSMLEAMTPFDLSGPKPAEDEGKEIPGGSYSGIRTYVAEKAKCVAARELTYADLQKPEISRYDIHPAQQAMFDRVDAAPKPADQEEFWQGLADSFYPPMHDQHTADVATLRRTLARDDAKPMTKDELIHRREEALKMRYPLLAQETAE